LKSAAIEVTRGEGVREHSPPQRIVSLTPSNTEIICALGAADRLVGISTYCDYPEEIAHLPRVARFIDADGDAIAKLRPDLVVTSSHLQKAIVADLVERDLAVLALNPTRLEEVFRDIVMLGVLVGAEARAHALVAQMRAQVLDVVARAHALPRRPRVYLEEWGKPLIPAGWWLAEFIEAAGGVNALPHIDSRRHSSERRIDVAAIADADPELILVSWPGVRSDTPRRRALERPEWREVAAVRRGHVYTVDDWLLHRPGPRVVDGLRAIAAHVERVARELEVEHG
jgi:iron complex transport system substrate-binding protein